MENSKDYFIEKVEKIEQRQQEEKLEKKCSAIFTIGGLALIGAGFATNMGVFSDTAIPYIIAANGVGMFASSVKRLVENSKKSSTHINQNSLKTLAEVEGPKQYRR